MTDEYQPTRKEVLSETWNGVRSKFTRENASKFGKSLKAFSEYTLGIGSLMLAIPYIVPTAVRNFRNVDENTSKTTLAEDIGGYTGTACGILADIGQLGGYYYVAKEGYPEFLLIPVATNLASGIYEIGRKMYNDAKQRVLEKHKPEGLEATLETTELIQE